MSRRLCLAGLILVVVLWSGVLLSPQMRLLLRAQAAPQWPILLAKIGVHDEGFKRVLREHPNDARVLAFEIEERVWSETALTNSPSSPAYDWRKENRRHKDFRKKRLRDADRLIEKFPNQEWLIQKRLLLSLRGGFTLNGAQGEVAPIYPAYINASELSPDDTRLALKVAERGARLDPQNSFYDWMRAAFLFSLHRDEEALQALKDGAQKLHYDDGILVDVQNRVAVRELQSALTWEDRSAILSSIYLPQYGAIRLTSYAAISRAVFAERNENHRRALEIYGAQMHLVRVMQRDARGLIDILIANDMEAKIWDTPPRQKQAEREAARKGEKLPRFPKRDSIAREKSRAFWAAQFANYARSHGRADLATLALSDAKRMSAQQFGNLREDNWFGVSTATVQPMFRLQWTSAMLLRAIVLSALAWLVLSALLRVMLRDALARSAVARASLLDVGSSALFASIFCAVVFVAILRDANWMDLIWSADNVFYRESDNPILNVAPNVMVWLPLILTLLYCDVVMLWRGRRSTPLAAASENGDYWQNLPLSKKGRVAVWLAVGAIWLIFSLRWLQWLGGQNLIDIITFPGLFLPVLVGWFCYRILRQFLSKSPARALVYALAWGRSTLGALIVVGSVAYFICALWALPLRKQADAKMDEYIAKGEVALMREAQSRQ